MPLTRYVFFRANEIRSVLSIVLLFQRRDDLIFEPVVVQVGLLHHFQFPMAEQDDLITEIQGQVQDVGGENSDPPVLQ